MMKKLFTSLCLAALATNAMAVDYYLVTPTAKAAAPVVGLSLSSYALPSGVVGEAYAGFDLNTLLSVTGDAGYAGRGASWQVTTGVLPAGLSLSASGQLTGTPTAAGTGNFTLKATYKTATGVQSYQVVVTNIQVALATASLPSGEVGKAYPGFDLNTLLSVTGDAAYAGSGASWQVVSGAMPAGLSLSAAGQLTGTPTTAGTGNVTLKASYRTASGEQSYQIVVTNIQVALAAATLPAGMVNSAYSYDFKSLLTVTGDSAYSASNVTFNVSSGSLPGGLQLSSGGQLSGTPSAVSGPVSFGVAAHYKTKQALQTYTIPSIAAAPVTGFNFASTQNGATILNYANTAYNGPNQYWPTSNHTISNPCATIWAVTSMLCMGNSVVAGSYAPANNYYVSTWGSTSPGVPQYAVIDLGQARTFNTAYFYQANLDGRMNTAELAVSNSPLTYADAGWTAIGAPKSLSSTDYTAQKMSFAPVTARYVRIKGSVASGYSFVELRGLQLFYE